jgi:hypothetical protein
MQQQTVKQRFGRSFELWLAIFFLVLSIFIRVCTPKPSSFPCPEGGKPVITTKSDTVYNPVKGDSTYKPHAPTTSTATKPTPEDSLYMPIGDYNALVKQYWELVDRFIKVNQYLDSINLIDKATGKSIGKVYLNDSIRSNELWSRNYQYTLSLPTITNTTTITIPPKQRFKLYPGFEVSGFRNKIIDAAGINLTAVTKREKMFSLHAGFNNTYKDWYGGLSMNWLLNLRRK